MFYMYAKEYRKNVKSIKQRFQNAYSLWAELTKKSKFGKI